MASGLLSSAGAARRRQLSDARRGSAVLAGREIHRAVARHFLAVDRAHRDFVRSGAPDVGHFAARGNRDEAAIRRAQHVLAHDRIGVQAQLRLPQRSEAEVEHLQREPVALRLIVLAHVAALLEHREQAMHGRRGLAQAPARGPTGSCRAARRSGPRTLRAPCRWRSWLRAERELRGAWIPLCGTTFQISDSTVSPLPCQGVTGIG